MIQQYGASYGSGQGQQNQDNCDNREIAFNRSRPSSNNGDSVLHHWGRYDMPHPPHIYGDGRNADSRRIGEHNISISVRLSSITAGHSNIKLRTVTTMRDNGSFPRLRVIPLVQDNHHGKR